MRVLNNGIAICTASDLPITTDGSIKAYILEDSVELYMLTEDKFCKVYVTLDMFDDLVEGKYVVEHNEENVPMLYRNDKWDIEYMRNNLTKFNNRNEYRELEEELDRNVIAGKVFNLLPLILFFAVVLVVILTIINQ